MQLRLSLDEPDLRQVSLTWAPPLAPGLADSARVCTRCGAQACGCGVHVTFAWVVRHWRARSMRVASAASSGPACAPGRRLRRAAYQRGG